MVDSHDDMARVAAAALITEKRDVLVAERTALLEQRSEILARLRRIDRELADCRAAARLFALEIDFPPDEREEAERAAMLRHRERELMIEMERQRDRERARAHALAVHGRVIKPATPARISPPAMPLSSPLPPPAAAPSPNEEAPAPMAAAPTSPPRPPLRQVLLDQLKLAGEAGSKAASLRDYFERTYGMIIHEKTVGMTLYRLLKEGLVRREGHIWFFGPAPSAETKNPGVAAPGSKDIFE